ncbi:HTH-type transcriptional regulator CynR [Grimontia celer]|uniref:HTH-type transcriptional regulator CynR n=1 Tax=Grimontia celer TaxID=1796497 RepID=A0A128F8E5_9GAMM|nr:LysR family transcriptional regulator [Grimontia celer]CZF82624.1 HTH-type transcriptional regulator CynR [Grimontia celer]
MNAQRLDWSDIPYVLAVCDSGSLSGAARAMKVNHSTVFRRIEGVESKLGVRLFERVPRGYVMTTAGELFYEKAKRLREGLIDIESHLGGQDLRLEGVLSVTTTDSILHWLTPLIQQFQTQHSAVELRLITEVRALDLMQRDADIALRPTNNPPEHWVGKNLMTLSYTAYAHRDYWQSVKDKPDNQRWICLSEELTQSPMNKLTRKLMSEGAPTTVANSVMGVFELVKGQLGIGVLPCYLGQLSDELVEVIESDPIHDGQLWLLAHPDVRRSARVNAFFEFVSQHISAFNKQ